MSSHDTTSPEAMHATKLALAEQGWKQRAAGGHMDHVGPLWTRREGDGFAYGLLVEARHLNPARVAHGGAIATLLDHAMSTVAWEAMQRQPCVTVQMNVQYLAPAIEGQFLVARCRVSRSGSSMLFVDGTLQAGDAEIARASAVMKAVGKRAGPTPA